MAIQVLNQNEIEEVSGGLALVEGVVIIAIVGMALAYASGGNCSFSFGGGGGGTLHFECR